MLDTREANNQLLMSGLTADRDVLPSAKQVKTTSFILFIKIEISWLQAMRWLCIGKNNHTS